jgi:nicotinamide-nucleotide amidase
MSKDLVQVSIITIGDELMIGQVVDTNSAWISRRLNTSGFWVRKRISVGDNYEEMWTALEEESVDSKLVLITGGLGPTADDITKPFLCDFFGTSLVIDDEVLAHIRHLFESVFKRPFTERNRKQAEVPAGCTVIPNTRGTAPGMMFEKDGVVYISMPGVPLEMKGMMTDLVIPLISKKFLTGNILHRTLLLSGIGESYVADHLQEWERVLPFQFKLAYLPNQGLLRLRITGTGPDEQSLKTELDELFGSLKLLVSQWMVTDSDLSMAQVITKMLKDRNKMLGVAESCTGGYIAHMITREAGASAIFKGGLVSYSNQVKTSVLHVDDSTLNSVGAVSEETVRQMVKGAIELLSCDYAIATSGIMGPDGGTPEKPVGMVWVAAGDRNEAIAEKFHFRYDRLRNIEMTSNNALNLLRKFINAH